MDTRVDSRVSVEIKQKTSKVLADHGLSLSAYIRMVLTSVANDGLPKYWGIPNGKTMSSIEEAINDLKTHKLEGATSYTDLEKLLDK
ncbi:type II toxin-antitoxin system RelB/DinJ family antitoxin [Lactobacillus johnsonii]|uniref:type II toxin-antitoxin system RelB/DinJ family antitoxin n=1 Tax=Lactobacillus johnsonii TaxID=33959 RepID=UPI00398B70CD